MPTMRRWDFLLGACLLAAIVQMVLLVRQRDVLLDGIGEEAAPVAQVVLPPASAEKADEPLVAVIALREELDALEASNSELKAERRKLIKARNEVTRDRDRLKVLLEEARARPCDHVNGTTDVLADTLRAELLASNDRLEKAYKDIAEMEKQLVDVSRMKNDLEQHLRRSQPPLPDPEANEPKIDGVVIGVSDKVNLVLISVGGKDQVKVGTRFTVYRGSEHVSKLVVDKVEDGWAACRELADFRTKPIEQGDSVTTRPFE